MNKNKYYTIIYILFSFNHLFSFFFILLVLLTSSYESYKAIYSSGYSKLLNHFYLFSSFNPSSANIASYNKLSILVYSSFSYYTISYSA